MREASLHHMHQLHFSFLHPLSVTLKALQGPELGVKISFITTWYTQQQSESSFFPLINGVCLVHISYILFSYKFRGIGAGPEASMPAPLLGDGIP